MRSLHSVDAEHLRPQTGGDGWQRAIAVLAVLTIALVAVLVLAGLHRTEAEREHAAASAATLPRDTAGYPLFEPAGTSAGFYEFIRDRVPPTDAVEYVVAGRSSCAANSRIFGRLLWSQFQLAPRPTVCGAGWRIYLDTALPPDVPAEDRYSDTMAVVPAR